jgi:hypothetical protein
MKTFANYLKKMSAYLLLMLIFGSANAQNGNSYITITGNLKDSKNKQNLVFAYVAVPNSHVGTVTNSDGEFTLKVNNDLKATEVEFSHLGYNKKRVPITYFKSSENIVYLEPSSISIDEVTIRPVDAKEIVKEALRKVSTNYSEAPCMLTGFYRETIRQRRDYISISEAVVDIYKASYKPIGGADRVRVFKGRKSADVKKADTLTVKLQGGPSVSLLLDVAKNPSLIFFDDDIDLYEFKMEDIVAIDNRINYVISFAQRKHVTYPMYYGRLYIDTKNLAFTHAQFSLNIENKDEAAQLFLKRKPRGVKFVPTSTSYQVTYNEQDGVYYLNYARHELVFKANWSRRLFNTTYTINAELAITDRSLDTPNRFPVRESFKPSDVLAESVTSFNDTDYWGEYNYIKPDESIEEAIRKYGRRLKRLQQ